MMSPMLFDVAAIFGLLMDRDEVSYLHDILSTNFGFQVNKKNSTYFTFINTFNRGSGPIGGIEYKAFLLF